jgi:2-polyprenyl-6-methoxyphenol hydroxylase-like FAD-dependent oxidoreductase
MKDAGRPLIVGAGPVGTAAALFLSRAGIPTRIVDKSTRRGSESRALAVNPRTLEILEPTGVTSRILARGRRVHGARLWFEGRVLRELDIGRLGHEYGFLVALSQATTERLLEGALQEAGGSVERGALMTACRNTSDGVEVEIEHHESGTSETVRAPWILASDGAHSVARHQLGVDFPGSSFERRWNLADVPLRCPLSEDFAHIGLLDAGFLFVMRVVGDEEPRGGDPLWRVLGNFEDPVARAEETFHARATGPPLWQSGFHIAHRLGARMQVGNVYFAGDAAHIHSPVGARGMNLGIEDVWVFSRLVVAGRRQDYGRLRWPVDRRVVRNIELVSRFAKGESATARLVRVLAAGLVSRLPLARDQMLETVAGLDHPLPTI